MKKVISLVLSGLFACCTFSACSSGVGTNSAAEKLVSDPVKTAKVWEHNAPTEVIYDCFGGRGDVMPLLGFWAAPPDATLNGQFFPSFKNDEYFAAVKEAGINIVMAGAQDAPSYMDETELMLELCDKYGIGCYITDSSMFSTGMTSSRDAVIEKLQNYLKHKSVAGMYLRDEPYPFEEDTVLKKGLINFYEIAETLGVNIQAYTNMYPTYVAPFQTQGPEGVYDLYRQYIDNIYKDTPAKFLLYDIYPLSSSGYNYDRAFQNISIVRNAANDMNKAWMAFISVSGEQDYVQPNEGETCWQVNMYLAFGAKGIGYFPINSPLSFKEWVEQGEDVAMFDYVGNKTPVYYYVKQCNKQVAAADEYLMLSTNHGVIFHGSFSDTQYLRYNEIIQGDKFRELTSVTGSKCLIGCFDYYGKTCLYVVNGSMYDDATISLGFDNRYGYTVIQRGKTVNVKGKRIDLQLAAGEAAFIGLQ